MEVPVSKYDAYPPGDVRDLSVSLVDQTATNVSIELKWTAPGDEIDWGFGMYTKLVCSICLFLKSTCSCLFKSFLLRTEVFG